MNVPKPCNTCANLCTNHMSRNDPDYEADCELGYRLGNRGCPDYRHCKKHKDSKRRESRDTKIRGQC